MIGITFILILWFLFYVLNKLAKFISAYKTNENSTENEKKRWYFGSWLAFVLILFGDEMIGGVQMGYLCSTLPEGEVFIEKIKKLEGQEVIYESSSEWHDFTILPVKKYTIKLIDIKTDDMLTKNMAAYYSRGGWLKRFIAFNGDRKPFLFYNQCSNEDEISQVESRYNLKEKNIFK